MAWSEHQEEAADLIWQLWQNGEVIEVLPDEMMPETRAEAYGIQALFEDRSKPPLFGWKIAATSADGQAHIGVEGPLAGRLFAERVVEADTELSLASNRMRVAEPEFAFRLGYDLEPRSSKYRMNDVLDTVEALHLAIEVPDSRFIDFDRVGALQLIADNACAHDLVLGPQVTEDWRSLDLAQHEVQAAIIGKFEHDGSGANVLGDPRIALTWLVNELSSLGIALLAGQIITTGTAVIPLPIVEGDLMQADFGELGTISVQFT